MYGVRLSAAALDLLAITMCPEAKRATLAQVLNHPWVRGSSSGGSGGSRSPGSSGFTAAGAGAEGPHSGDAKLLQMTLDGDVAMSDATQASPSSDSSASFSSSSSSSSAQLQLQSPLVAAPGALSASSSGSSSSSIGSYEIGALGCSSVCLFVR